MKLAGEAKRIELPRDEPDPGADCGGEATDVVEVRAEIRVALAQRLQEHVRALAARRATPALLGFVQPLVGEPQGAFDIVGVVWQEHRAVRTVDRPALASIGERGERTGEDLVDTAAGDQDAELVAAQAVGAAVARRGREA